MPQSGWLVRQSCLGKAGVLFGCQHLIVDASNYWYLCLTVFTVFTHACAHWNSEHICVQIWNLSISLMYH